MTYKYLILSSLVGGALLVSPLGFAESDSSDSRAPHPSKSYPKRAQEQAVSPYHHAEDEEVTVKIDQDHPAEPDTVVRIEGADQSSSDALRDNPAPNPEKSAGKRTQREAETSVDDSISETEVAISSAAGTDLTPSTIENDALSDNPAPNPEKRVNQPGRDSNAEPLIRVTRTDRTEPGHARVDIGATQPEIDSESSGLASSAGRSEIIEQIDDEVGAASVSVINAGDTLGWDVVDIQGNKLGDLTDYAIRPEEQEIAYLVVAAGGILGVGGRDHYLQPSQIERVNDEHQLVVDLSKDEFDELANIDSADEDSLIRFFSEIEGERAVNEEGVNLGSIQDMLVRFDGGNVAHLVLNPERAFVTEWGYGFRVAIPAKQILKLKGNGDLVLDVDRDDVLGAELAESMEDARLLEANSGAVYRVDLSGTETALRD